MSPMYLESPKDAEPPDATTSTALLETPLAPDASEAGEPPSDLLPPTIQPTRPTPPPWRFIAIIALVVALVATGVGIGFVSGRHNATSTSTASAGPTVSTSSSSTTLPSTVTDLQQTIITVTKNVQASVVEVTSSGSSGSAIGSGEFLTKDGYIATNNHVVSGFTSFRVTLSNDAAYTATLVGTDPQDDLAVLKIAITDATPIAIEDSGQASVGEFVLAIGNPLGLQESTSFGIISAVNRTETEESTSSNSAGVILTGLIQTTAALNPGNSGGALVNLEGQLVGIPTLGATTTSSGETVSGIGFAISTNRVVYVVNQLMKSGHVTTTNQGFLGVEGRDVTGSSGLTTGVQVAAFATDAAGASPAQSGGIQVGDLITAIDGQTITNSEDLAGAVLTLTPGTPVKVTLQRGSSTTTVTVTLGQRPVANA